MKKRSFNLKIFIIKYNGFDLIFLKLIKFILINDINEVTLNIKSFFNCKWKWIIAKYKIIWYIIYNVIIKVENVYKK